MTNDMALPDELRRTHPDYVVYIPGGAEKRLPDSANEHFLVFRRGDGTLAAVWTQSGFEGQANQHIVFAESDAHGKTWSRPRLLAGNDADPKTGKGMCSWGYPLVSRSGRIYVLYSKHTGVNDIFTHTTGILTGIHSDDQGRTWSAEAEVRVPRTRYDHPDPAVPQNCITWQKPLRFGDGRYLAGVTRWFGPHHGKSFDGNWFHVPSVVDFLRFENLDDDPAVADLDVTLLTQDRALEYPIPSHPESSVLQEPSLVNLPDGRLLSVMRTVAGTPAWSISSDVGKTWSCPEALRYGDGLPTVKHPLSPCPCYEIGSGEYAFFFHNHDGAFGPWAPHVTQSRRPIYLSFGRFDPEGRQPVRFSAPISWMDSDNVDVNNRCDLALYSSMEIVDGKPVLWYPDRKHFLVGRVIDRALLDKAVFPK